MIKNFVKGKEANLYSVFRILVGLMFLQHGMQKILGMLGAQGTAAFPTIFWFAGIIELVGGTFIALGLFTRLASMIAALEMAIAYLMTHASKSFFPIMNGGELAVMFFAAFLVITAYGSGKWSLEKMLLKKEHF
ncbi:DoxX family protein [Candidatus Woesearchaeota archaeon]|nr:DoxX family protein [Candidatus Woesearchaeota archaeon]